ncbi:MAG: DJ-1/PfpI family protein [Kiloniellales bacterium]|nr:DJ-1/PfpI family protein [Kiloniellales bacterium]
MTITLGILLFNEVEELDAVGPWEVLRYAELNTAAPLRVMTLGEEAGEVTCAKGLKLRAETAIAEAPQLDVLLVPGGQGSRRVAENQRLLSWIAAQAEGCRWVTSVCTGARVLLAAGPARGKRITTYHGAVEELRAGGLAAEVLEGVRFVRDGKLVTSAGVSAGIDMSLWLLGQLFTPALARAVQQGIEYFPAPPYTAETEQPAAA